MKFTVAFVTFLCISSSWAVQVKKTEEPKDKREAPVGYPSSGYNSYNLQSPSLGHDDQSAISIGAGYSVGGAKPSFNFGGQGSSLGHLSSEGLPSSGHATIQLSPITLQPSHGGLAGSDLSQLMSQLSQGLNSGAISLQSPSSFGGYSSAGQGSYGGQTLSLPQYTYGGPKLQQYAVSEQSQSSVPSYASGSKGLGSYSTGPVLFNPESYASQPSISYGGPSSGHSLGDSSAISLSGSGHSLEGISLGGGSGQSFGGSLKNLGSSYVLPSKASFKPSAFLGASVHSDSGHGLSSSSGSYSAPSFGGLSGNHGGLSSLSAGGHSGLAALSSGGHSGLSSLSSGGHGANFGSFGGIGGGSSKFISPTYLPSKSEGFGSSLESVASFSTNGHLSSPPGTTYGIPSASYAANSAHAASSANPQYYVAPKQSSGFGEGATSFKAPISGHSSLSSYSSGPKYSFGGFGGSGSRYGAPKDTHGAYSESTYNTIKYSEPLKPHNIH